MEQHLSIGNTEIYLQPSQAGVMARIEWPDRFEHAYVGPLSDETAASLWEVSQEQEPDKETECPQANSQIQTLSLAHTM